MKAEYDFSNSKPNPYTKLLKKEVKQPQTEYQLEKLLPGGVQGKYVERIHTPLPPSSGLRPPSPSGRRK